MQAEPQKEHRWLEALLGDWTMEAVADCGPDQSQTKTEGRESVRSLGGLWVQCEGRGEMPGGGAATMQMTLGYDPQRQKFVGTWIGSMMTHLWVYEGTLDESETVLTLEAEGPDFARPGQMAKYRDVIQLKGPDHRTLTSQLQGEDGDWHAFMWANYYRVK
ncbi:MAG: DUF1579 domain-containing protein [Armatimonadota bacterium]